MIASTTNPHLKNQYIKIIFSNNFKREKQLFASTQYNKQNVRPIIVENDELCARAVLHETWVHGHAPQVRCGRVANPFMEQFAADRDHRYGALCDWIYYFVAATGHLRQLGERLQCVGRNGNRESDRLLRFHIETANFVALQKKQQKCSNW